jgi:DNA-binding GntR family transcriptional regulator
LREALKALTAESMVTHHRNRGHFVAELTAEEMADLCWTRDFLEAELARTAVPASSADLTHLGKLNDQLEVLATSAAASAELVEVDNRFHETLWRLSPRGEGVLARLRHDRSRTRRARDPGCWRR